MDKPEIWYMALAALVIYFLWRERGTRATGGPCTDCAEDTAMSAPAATCTPQAVYL